MFIKELKNDSYYFKDCKNNKEVKFAKRQLIEDIYSYDVLRISEDLDYKFIDFIFQELIKTKDLLVIEVLFQNKDIIDLIHKNNLKICNFNYVIPFREYKVNNEYEFSECLNAENKKYFLNHINEVGKLNQKYINPDIEYMDVTEKWFQMEDYKFLTYKKNNKLVGIVDFKIFDAYECNDKIYDCSNSICIRSVFANNQDILESMLKDLMKQFQKRVVISHLYTENMLKEAILNCGGILKYLYVINKNNRDN